MKKFLMFLILCALSSSAGASFATDALFDENHGQYWPMSSNDNFDSARAYITDAGHTISALNDLITLEALTGFDLFVTGTFNSSLAATEIEALDNFVSVGGTILVNHDGGWSSNAVTPVLNSFLATYGITLASSSTSSGGLLVEGFSDHCLTENVSSLALDYVRLITNISSPSVDLTTNTDGILAVFEHDSGGKIIVLPDDSLWSDSDSALDYSIDNFDNLTMLLNIFECANGSVATEVTTWDALKSFYR